MRDNAVSNGETINERLVDHVKSLVEGHDTDALKKLIEELAPADVADLLEHLDHDERLFIFDLLEPEGAADILVEIEPPVQGRLLEDLDNEVISDIVEELDSDDAADLLGDLPEDRARQIIETVDDETSRDLEKLLPYRDDSAGGIMALEFVAVQADATVQDAIDTIRRKKEEVERVYSVWVVDGYGRLVGVVALSDLVLEQPDQKIREIMDPDVVSVKADADQEEVVRLVKKYDLVSIPVVDNKHRLVGRITHDDIVDVMEEETDEDIAIIAGILPQDITESSPTVISKARLPWLLGALLGELVAAFVISRFEGSLAKVVALSFFFPVIMAMGGNSGTQAAIVVVRGLATGDISMVKIWKRLWVELRVALINGLICGSILALVVGTWLSDPPLGAVVGLALVSIILFSGFAGSAIPLLLKRMKVDPALGTGPFVATSNDILGIFIYLGLITLFLWAR
ncbi:MAG: magnesium transporter [Desulfobacteraceae bacterium]|nr:MAG: magnesium transporter [Desulfobacteraceae bacterium]